MSHAKTTGSARTRGRPRYQRAQWLHVSDLQDERDYLDHAMRVHLAAAHAAGVEQGLAIRVRGDTFVLEPGVAVDGFGFEIVVREILELPLQQTLSASSLAGVKTVHVTIARSPTGSTPAELRFRREVTEPPAADAGASRAGETHGTWEIEVGTLRFQGGAWTPERAPIARTSQKIWNQARGREWALGSEAFALRPIGAAADWIFDGAIEKTLGGELQSPAMSVGAIELRGSEAGPPDDYSVRYLEEEKALKVAIAPAPTGELRIGSAMRITGDGVLVTGSLRLPEKEMHP